MILAGDIITFGDYRPLARFLENWSKPVLYVPGNHEYYTQTPIDRDSQDFAKWLSENLPHVVLLQDEGITIGGVHFFGGTMWTDFANENPLAMMHARQNMNDFRLIRNPKQQTFSPEDSVELHKIFLERLLAWFREDLKGPRVVITHHAPVVNPDTQFGNSALQPAFNSMDMVEVIETYRPDLWVYGHTHECHDQVWGATRILSNQLGYPNGWGGYECRGFDDTGKPVTIGEK